MAEYAFNIRRLDTEQLVASLPRNAFLHFFYDRRVNDSGTFEGTINTQLFPWVRNLINLRGERFPHGITLDNVLEVWRKPVPVNGSAGIWRLEGQYFIRYVRDQMMENGVQRFSIVGRDVNHVLSRAMIFPRGAIPPEHQSSADFLGDFPWTLPTEETFKGQPYVGDTDSTAEKMYGMFLNAQANNDVALDPTFFGNASIDPGGIPEHIIGERYSNLLEALQNASGASWFASYYALESTPADEGCDFAIMPTVSSPPYWPWDFTVFVGGRGVDRRIGGPNELIFSAAAGNMDVPVYIHDMLQQKTRVAVGGAKEGVNRDVILVTNPTVIGWSPLNKNDQYIDARQAEEVPPKPGTVAADFGQLVKDGLWTLKEQGEQEEVTFQVGRNVEYGVDFDLGDLVTVSTPYLLRDYQIRNIYITLDERGQENVQIEFGLLDGTSVRGRDLLEQMLQLIRENQKKMEEGQAAE